MDSVTFRNGGQYYFQVRWTVLRLGNSGQCYVLVTVDSVTIRLRWTVLLSGAVDSITFR